MVLETAKRYRRGVPEETTAAASSQAPQPTAVAPQVPPAQGVARKTSSVAVQRKLTSGVQDVANPSYGRWTENEKSLYREAMAIYGKGRWKLVAKHVGTRTSTQCKTHHQKVVEKETKRTDLGGVVDDERFADAEEDETPGREEAIVAKVLCDYRNDRPNEMDPFDYSAGGAHDLVAVAGGNLNDLVQAIDPSELAAAGDPLVHMGSTAAASMEPNSMDPAVHHSVMEHPEHSYVVAPAPAHDPHGMALAAHPAERAPVGIEVPVVGAYAEAPPTEQPTEMLPVEYQNTEMKMESL
mmetsp:Transcript_7194/g.21376  ORF Transcript_7194/g.21376 Transcript_7194/m.21376 type:complete len:296 (-) Transcript_7194:396-1283(-)